MLVSLLPSIVEESKGKEENAGQAIREQSWWNQRDYWATMGYVGKSGRRNSKAAADIESLTGKKISRFPNVKRPEKREWDRHSAMSS